ncbi:acetamidase/formamidase family protein [Mangrovicella endophytica]|uniref:acetamidase/formamidase family protein n=1 Tax=Mangrovicella endophytica TaxID=2066697 RepID=UPI001FDEA63A|nr:acetamidase/formamidase family protein [Mangrovicella endophytica]
MKQGAARTLLDAFPAASRAAVWNDALAGALLTARAVGASLGSAEVAVRRSGSGARLARIRAGAQTLAPLAGRTVPTLALVLVLSGRGRIETGDRGTEIVDSDLVVLDLTEDWTIGWRADFDILLLLFPGQRLLSRLGRAPVALPTVLGSSRAAAAARPVMRMLGPDIEAVDDADLASMENALVELVVSALLAEGRRGEAPASSVRTAHMRRVTAAIGARLGDADLSLADIARQERLSVRYLQRLFEEAGEAFSDHLRRRRLERCWTDLCDPRHAADAIAEIAWRWGFRDQAHFSRAFSAQYGVSPREARRQERAQDAVRLNRGRPARTPAGSVARQAGLPAGALSLPHPPSPLRTAAIPPRASEPPQAMHHLPISPSSVHWGFLSRSLPPVLRIGPGEAVRVETLTQHGCDDWERLIRGDPAAEAVFAWSKDGKRIERRGAGPMNASIFGRGAGEGFGVHILTGPIHVEGAEPGDVLEVEFLDIAPRPCGNPAFAGKAFASNVSAWWGYQYHDPLESGRRREVVTLYEIDLGDPREARPLYSYVWTPQTDPFGVRHETIDYPGIPVDPATVQPVDGILKGVSVPARPHFGFVAVAPRESELVDTIPPGYFGGNIDNWRASEGSRLFLPVAVPGALLSLGDGHFSQGDGEINGTGLECSLTGTIRVRLHKRSEAGSGALAGLTAPLIETHDAFVVQGFSYTNYLKELGRAAQSEVYSRSTLDLAMRSAFRQARRFLMDAYGLAEDEALSLMSVAVDFAVTQVADGNFGVHAVIRKALFAPAHGTGLQG